MADQGGFNLGSWDWWTEPKDWLGPNTQYGLAGMAAAIDKGAPTGNIGEMMQQYIQGQASQEAFKEQMLQRQEFFDALAAMLGQGPQKQEMLGARSGEVGDWGTYQPSDLGSSQDWLYGGGNGGLIPTEEQVRQSEIQKIARELAGDRGIYRPAGGGY